MNFIAMHGPHARSNHALESPRLPWAISLVIFTCFLLSGASALIYQVAWVRHLTLILGSTSFAVSTVLTAFMAGLALGSYAGGRLIDRAGAPLLVYAALELIIGLYALIIPWVFEAISPVYQWAWLNFHPQFYAFSLLRFAMVFLALLIPTSCMGATLPALAKFYALSPAPFALNVGRLYAINTFGAVLGTLAAGFWLMPRLGLTRTVWVASGINVGLAALIGVSIWASPPAVKRLWLVRAPAAEAGATDSAGDGRRWRKRFLLLSFALTGACAMALEVAWTRVLSLVLGPSVYAFALMLTTFLLGLGLGSFLGSQLLSRWKVDAFRFLFGLLLLIGLAVFATLLSFNQLPYAYAYVYFRWDVASFDAGVWLQFALAFLVMFVPTLLMGGVFPAMARAFEEERPSAGKAIGRLYAANTVGAILGSFLAGFALIPLIGIQNVVMAAIAVYLLLSAAAACADLLRRKFAGRTTAPSALRYARAALPLLAWALVQWLAPGWDQAAMTSGMNHYAWWLRPAELDENLPFVPTRADFQRYVAQLDVLFYREDLDTTVTVARELNVPPQPLGDQRVESLLLINNGKIDASSHFDMPTQILSGHLGALLHPGRPQDALVIGLASGTTAGSLLTYPLKRVEVLEISQAVVEASHLFDHVNGRPLQDSRTRLIVNDGRNYLLVAPQRYDLIVSEPSNPWISGPSHLFTQEFFQIAKDKLKADGLLVQWVQLYAMSAQNLRTLIKTMHSTFPHVFIFSGLVASDLLLVGSLEPLALDVQAIQARLKGAAAQDLARISIHGVLDVLARFRLGSDEVASLYHQDTPLNTDDNALIEYAAPRDLYKSTRKENNAMLEAHTQGPAKYLIGLDGDAMEKGEFFLELGRLYAELGLQTSSQKMAQEAEKYR